MPVFMSKRLGQSYESVVAGIDPVNAESVRISGFYPSVRFKSLK